MKDEQIKDFNFPEEWLKKENDHGSLESLLGFCDYELTKTIYTLGGLKAVESYIDLVWDACHSMSCLVELYDLLFRSENEDEDTTKLLKETVWYLRLPLADATSQVDYKYDPHDECESRIDAFGRDLANKLQKAFDTMQ